jgi:hypothetical protein
MPQALERAQQPAAGRVKDVKGWDTVSDRLEARCGRVGLGVDSCVLLIRVSVFGFRENEGPLPFACHDVERIQLRLLREILAVVIAFEASRRRRQVVQNHSFAEMELWSP